MTRNISLDQPSSLCLFLCSLNNAQLEHCGLANSHSGRIYFAATDKDTRKPRDGESLVYQAKGSLGHWQNLIRIPDSARAGAPSSRLPEHRDLRSPSPRHSFLSLSKQGFQLVSSQCSSSPMPEIQGGFLAKGEKYLTNHPLFDDAA